jgi:hypothetical protein
MVDTLLVAVPSKNINDEKVVVSDATALNLLVSTCSSIGKAESDGLKPRNTRPQASTRFFRQNERSFGTLMPDPAQKITQARAVYGAITKGLIFVGSCLEME